MNIKEAIDQHIKTLELIRANQTARSYRNGCNTFLQYLKNEKVDPTTPLEGLTVEHFINYPIWLAGQGYAKKTISVYNSGVKSFMDWLLVEGYIEMTYNQGIRYVNSIRKYRRKRESRLPRWPEKNDATRMVKAAKEKSADERRPLAKLRDVALVLLLYSTGCRNNEAAALTLGNIDIKSCKALVIGKGDKERKVFFSQECADALWNYWQARGPILDDLPAFSRHDRGAQKKIKGITTATVRNIIKEISILADVHPFTPHYFRHAFAIRMLNETDNLAIVQDLLGHSDPSATRVYAKIYEEDLQRAHRKVYG